jgi:hypothetical protein
MMITTIAMMITTIAMTMTDEYSVDLSQMVCIELSP